MSMLLRYNPYRELETVQRYFNRLFDEVSGVTPAENDLNYVPAAELSETEEAYLLKLEVPGIKPEDLDIQVSKNAVSITGERKEETQTENNGITRSEFRYGKFQRVISLKGIVQNTEVKADYKDGILTLTLPKVEEEKNKVVKVQIG